MKQDNQGCARLVLGGLCTFIILCSSFILLVFLGFRAEPVLPPTSDTNAREELRIEWEDSGDVDADESGFFTPDGARVRDLTESESQGLAEWRLK